MAEYKDEGTLLTDKRQIDDAQTWTDDDWDEYQSKSNIEIVDGRVQLAEGGIPDSGVSRWLFEETLDDEWGDNDGTNNGGSFSTTAKVGSHSYELNGTDAYAEVPHDSSLDFLGESGGSFTVTFWLRPASLQSFVITKNDNNDASTDPIKIEITDGGTVNWIVADGGDWDSISMGSISTGEWWHFAVVYNAGTRMTYRDASEQNTDDISDNDWSTDMPLTFGCRYNNDRDRSKFYDGLIDSVRLFDAALSASEIQDIYDEEN